MLNRIYGLGITLAIAGVPLVASADDLTRYRVFVGDHKAAKVTAFDLSDPQTHWLFDTAGQVKLYPVANGGAVVAVQSDDDQVNFIQSGIRVFDHGGHADIEISDPLALSEVLQGPRPFHLLDHDGHVSINFDKGGYAAVVDGYELTKGNLESQQVSQNVAHHGVVVPWHNGWLTSVASEEPMDDGKAPPRVGVQQLSADGAAIGDLQACTNLHGEAYSGAYLMFGCKEGVLSVKQVSGKPQFKMLPYPESFPSGHTTGTLVGSKGMQAFLGNYGYEHLVVIDPEGQPTMQLVDLPFRRVDFQLDPVDVMHGYAFTENGALHKVSLLDAEIVQSIKVTQPYSMDGHWNDPRPRIAFAGDEILVTDPRQSLVHRISTKDLSKVGSVKVAGEPYNLTVVGGSGVSH